MGEKLIQGTVVNESGQRLIGAKVDNSGTHYLFHFLPEGSSRSIALPRYDWTFEPKVLTAQEQFEALEVGSRFYLRFSDEEAPTSDVRVRMKISDTHYVRFNPEPFSPTVNEISELQRHVYLEVA